MLPLIGNTALGGKLGGCEHFWMQGVLWCGRGFAMQPSLEFRQDAFGGHEPLPSLILTLRVDGFDEFIGQAEAR